MREKEEDKSATDSIAAVHFQEKDSPDDQIRPGRSKSKPSTRMGWKPAGETTPTYANNTARTFKKFLRRLSISKVCEMGV